MKNFVPIKIYFNFYHDRKNIRRNHIGKISGIYIFVNLINPSKTYIGQSSNILGRINNYLNNRYLNSHQNSNIPFTKALLKHGQRGFCLIIIEYVSVDKLSEREIYWISILNPYYNVLRGGRAGSAGFIHSDKTKALIREQRLGSFHTVETKALISKANANEKNSFYGKTHTSETKALISSKISGGQVYIYDSQWLLVIVVQSVSMLSKSISRNSSSIVSAIQNKSLFRGNWYFSYFIVNNTDRPLIKDVYSSYANIVFEDIVKARSIRKAVFLFSADTNEFIRRYNGVIECAKDLNISHNTISKMIPINGKISNIYIVSAHRVIK